MAAQLELHEGLRLKIYQDTEGYDTLGIGYNVSARGLEEFEHTIGHKFTGAITTEDARKQLLVDIDRYEAATRTHFPEYDTLSEVRQRVVLDLAFNLGYRALAFKQCIAAIRERDWSRAARELYRSRWARQVDDGPGGHFGRADRLANMLLTGNDYTT
jgi:lysozyme